MPAVCEGETPPRTFGFFREKRFFGAQALGVSTAWYVVL